MNRWICSVSAAALAAIATSAAPAAADLGSCADIYVTAQAKCEVVPPSVDCTKRCTPISIKAVCSARLAASCDASCSKLPSVECSGSCSAGCEGDCTVDPGKFDCQATCEADCSGRCDAGCSSKGDKTQCAADCMGSCSVSCQKSCDIDLPKADCTGQCKASCDGSCKVETNLDCQIDCQADGYVDCEADVKGGCEVDCKGKEGALFCDGQYVDHGDNLKMCIDALKARVDIRIEADSSGSSGCDGGTCSAEGKAGVSSDCSVAQVGRGDSSAPAWFGLAGLGVLAARRRRHR